MLLTQYRSALAAPARVAFNAARPPLWSPLVLSTLVVVYLIQVRVLPEYPPPEGYHTWLFAYSASTWEPYRITSYITAGITHSSWFHLGRNLVLLSVPMVFLERKLGFVRTLAVFAIAAPAATGAYAIVGNHLGYMGNAVGASGASYGLLTLFGLVAHYGTVSVHGRTLTVPFWLMPVVLTAIEMARAADVLILIGSSPMVNLSHSVGIVIGVAAWVSLGCPQSRLQITLTSRRRGSQMTRPSGQGRQQSSKVGRCR